MFRSLIITSLPPLPPADAISGAHKRMRTFVNAIAGISHSIEYLGLAPEDDVKAYQGHELNAALSSHWGHTVSGTLSATRHRQQTYWSYYGAGIFSAAAQPWFYQFSGPDQVDAVRTALNRKPDLTFVSRLGAMLPVMRSGIKPARLFFDLDDVEHIANIRKSLARPHSAGSAVHCIHSLALLVAERQAAKLARGMFVCSDKDQAHLHRLGFGRKVKVVPNSVSIPALRQTACEPENLMFIGTYWYRPNVDGASRLINKIWPLILARRPNAKLIIAGPNPEAIPEFHASPAGVEFTGLVPDLEALYARSGIIVCPLNVGAGTRLKLLEAGSFAKPMVSTSIGVEGLDLKDGVEILIRDHDREFAEACCRLLESASLRRALGDAAYAKVSESYDAAKMAARIAGLLMA